METSTEPAGARDAARDGVELARWATDLVAGRAPGLLSAASPDRAVEYFAARGLAGLAWATIDRGEGKAHDDVAAALRAHAAFATVRGGEALEAARAVRAALAAEGIDTLLFKGAALVELGVWSLAERPFSDVDLLVRRGEAERAVTLLRDSGLEPWRPWRAERLEWLSAFTMDRPGPTMELTVTFDVHWATRYGDLRQRAHATGDPLWNGADLARGLPSPEGHFVMIADHVLKHLHVLTHFSGLADLVRLLPQLHSDAEIASHTSARGIESRLPRLMDVLVQSFDVPADAFRRLPRACRPTGRRVPWELSAPRIVAGPPAASGRGGGLALRWKMGASALRDLRDVILPDARWLRARYPDRASTSGRRLEHFRRITGWFMGRGPSPVSPNQVWE
jgi:hypothetical protein